MKKKIFAFVLCFIIVFSIPVSVSAAKETETMNLFGFDERYTDISEIDELGNPMIELSEENKKENEDGKKLMYIIILSVLLVIAIGVFIYTLRKVPDEETFEIEEKKKIADSADSAEGKE